MSRLDDRNYHENRAQAELRCAEESLDPAAAALHRELAALHRRRLIAIVGEGKMQQTVAVAQAR